MIFVTESLHISKKKCTFAVAKVFQTTIPRPAGRNRQEKEIIAPRDQSPTYILSISYPTYTYNILCILSRDFRKCP